MIDSYSEQHSLPKCVHGFAWNMLNFITLCPMSKCIDVAMKLLDLYMYLGRLVVHISARS